MEFCQSVDAVLDSLDAFFDRLYAFAERCCELMDESILALGSQSVRHH